MESDAIELRLVFEIYRSVGRPTLRIEPPSLFPWRRIAAINADEDNFGVFDWADQRENLPFEFSRTARPFQLRRAPWFTWFDMTPIAMDALTGE